MTTFAPIRQSPHHYAKPARRGTSTRSSFAASKRLGRELTKRNPRARLSPLKAKKKHIIVAGAGIQGLSTAIAFQELGYHVTVLESERNLGRGLSWRPKFNQYGIIHSGAFFPDNKRAWVCDDVYKLLNGDPREDGNVTRIFRRHSIKTGKLVVARPGHPEDMEKLAQIAETLTARGVKFKMLATAKELNDLGETVVNSKNTQAAILLEDVRIEHISNCIEDLRKKFEANGGELHFAHKVTDFTIPTEAGKGNGTGVICDTPRGKTVFRGDAVINCTGTYAGVVAKKAAKALRTSKKRGLGAEASPPKNPRFSFSNLYVYVWNGPEDKAPQAKHLSYFAGNAKITGKGSTVGAHVYLSMRRKNGFTITIGPFSFPQPIHKVGQREALPLPELDADMIADMVAKARVVYPEFDPKDWKLMPAGSTFHAHRRKDDERDCITTVCFDRKTGMYVVNRLTGDTPGVTASAPLAYETAREVHERLNELDFLPSPATRANQARSQPGIAYLG